MDHKPFVGQLDRIVQIIELTQTTSNAGGVTETETVLLEPWAKMEDVSGDEVEEGRVIHLYKRNYVVRWHPDIVAKSNALILKDGAQRFAVVHVMEMGRKDYLKVIVKLYE